VTFADFRIHIHLSLKCEAAESLPDVHAARHEEGEAVAGKSALEDIASFPPPPLPSSSPFFCSCPPHDLPRAPSGEETHKSLGMSLGMSDRISRWCADGWRGVDEWCQSRYVAEKEYWDKVSPPAAAHLLSCVLTHAHKCAFTLSHSGT
jgi:hypothetical protein